MTVINVPTDADNNLPGKTGSLYDLAVEKKIIAEGIEEIKMELSEKWRQKYGKAPIFPSSLNNIHPEVTRFMLSFKITEFYNNLTRKMNLDQNQRERLPQIIWKMVLAKNYSNLVGAVEENLKLERGVADQLSKLIEQNILFKVQELAQKPILPKVNSEEEMRNRITSMNIGLALKKYERLGEQMLAGNQIKLKIFPTLVRPSIKNWIADYYEKVDARKHDSIERGNYLFHSENARRLTTGERQKVGTVLKSLDEDSPLTIDPQRQEVIFQSGLMQEPMSNVPETSNVSSKPEMNFTSPHQFPSEIKRPSPAPSMPSPASRVVYLEPRIQGNVVDLKNQG